MFTESSIFFCELFSLICLIRLLKRICGILIPALRHLSKLYGRLSLCYVLWLYLSNSFYTSINLLNSIARLLLFASFYPHILTEAALVFARIKSVRVKSPVVRFKVFGAFIFATRLSASSSIHERMTARGIIEIRDVIKSDRLQILV